ncbi:ComEA family DNA-binding protein [Protaetiibacter larvae]|uniref:ComEA family DNA-binding protein n=1 Tax=Protaetiibacter larvae TaxID=2592654 RepID=A0A5C1Y7I7_9MICO|nr:ComEA family DNA-binding protein [Protaetiibacter larvae]QEO09791.1 ComEA family DNA-binding protein [Protaetiibacter larvae]
MSDRPDPGILRARVRRGVGAALVVLLAGAAIAVFVAAITPRGGARQLVATEAASPADGLVDAGSGTTVYVHVLGQVARPGLYALRDGDRVVDAIAAAGGLTEAADPAGVNLARTLSDGEQLVVPAVGETPAGGPAGVAADGRVDLNAADAATLDTLPRIGPAMAQRIIDWREANGPFSSVDDLLAVSGIGSKTVEALRPLVLP